MKTFEEVQDSGNEEEDRAHARLAEWKRGFWARMAERRLAAQSCSQDKPGAEVSNRAAAVADDASESPETRQSIEPTPTATRQ